MRLAAAAVFVFVLVACASALLRHSPEPSARVPSEWIQRERVADAGAVLEFTFALRLSASREQLHETLMSVADPLSPHFRDWFSLADMDRMTAPSIQSVDATATFVHENGGVVRSDTRAHTSGWLMAEMSVADAQRAFATTLHWFEHAVTGERIVRAADAAYTLPKHLARHVAFVSGLSHFYRPRRATLPAGAVATKVAPDVDLVVDPAMIKTIYETGTTKASLSTPFNQSVVQFLGQYADSLDLDEFFALFDRAALGSKPVWLGPDDGLPGLEASLDIEYIMSIGEGVPTVFWSTPQNKTYNQEPFLTWATAVSQDPAPPLVFSISYGDDEASLDAAYLERVDAEFQKLGARGITVAFASGDSGAGCTESGNQFSPDFPASSMYVLAVGGSVNDVVDSTKEQCNWLSGGGFSNVFPQPSWQLSAVQGYLNSTQNLPPASFFNASGRGYPDISALSQGFVIVIDLIPTPGVAGTSCASPTAMGVFSLVNDYSFAHGGKQVGFAAPWLYASQPMNKIVAGCSIGCSNGGFCADPAGGWSPCSGLGTPRYTQLVAALNSTQPI